VTIQPVTFCGRVSLESETGADKNVELVFWKVFVEVLWRSTSQGCDGLLEGLANDVTFQGKK
jgi:hypothetical protein